MPKILSIVWYKVLPAVFGGQKGIANFQRELAAHFELTCLCANNNVSTDASYKLLPVLPTAKSQFFNLRWRARIIQRARDEAADIILLEHPYHGWAAVGAKNKTKALLVVHSHNIESERFRHIGKWWWRLLFKYERWTHRRADLSLFKTNTDAEFAQRKFGLAASRTMIVPYAVEEPQLLSKAEARKELQQRFAVGDDEKIFLFAGTLDYTPNADAVKNIYEEIAPRLDQTDKPYKIIICGRNRFASFQYLQGLQHASIIQAGEVEDMNLYWSAADAFINPITWSGGVQTKNLDALSAHLNLVCFEGLVDEDTISVAEAKIFTAKTGDWNDFVSRMNVATNLPLRTPSAFFAFYNWKTVAASVAHRLRQLLKT